MISGHSSTSVTFVLRLVPGEDLRRALERFTAEQGLRAAYVAACAGSLKVAAVRFADAGEPTLLRGPFEIVSLSGTLSPDGPHLHVALAGAGGDMVGGHLGVGSIVHTTAEIVVVELGGLEFSREEDGATGYRELSIRQN